MTTNFTLSLSFDGIKLFHRVTDGWHLVGETAIDVPDLPAALAKLRADAALLDPSDMRCKLLIPDAQIKYVTLETAQTDLQDVMSALEGATPYGVEELVVDFDRNGGRTFIAAVARETLAEAEGFATEHGFNPVAFAAVPDPMTFKSEVFFGPTDAGKSGPPITRDAAPVVQTGIAVIPADPAEPPVFTPRPRMAAPESVVPPTPPTPETAPPKPETPPQDEVLFTPRTAAVIAPVMTGDAPVIAVQTPSADVPAPAVTPPAPAMNAPPLKADDLAEQGGFSTRRKVDAPQPPATPEPPVDKPAKLTRKQKKAAAFATKQAQPVRGKPRFMGLILTAILIAFMALVALWASTLSEEDIANWFGFGAGGILETAEIPPPEIMPATPVIQEAPVVVATETAPLPQLREDATGEVLSPAQAARIYAATGVWQRAPRLPLEPRTEEFAATFPTLSAMSVSLELPALPQIAGLSPDLNIVTPSNPMALGTDFDRDENGLVRATPEGALTPQGVLVFAGPPPSKPPFRQVAPVEIAAEIALETAAPDTPDGVIVISGRPSKIPPLRPIYAALPAPDTTDAPDATAGAVALAGLRPSLRPQELAPPQEDVAPPADLALASKRPQTRPAGLAPVVAATPAPQSPDLAEVMAAISEAVPRSTFVNTTAQAVAASSRPDTRPRNFARVVARARDLQAQQTARAATAATAAQPAAAVSNAPARASGNTTASVAQAATLSNAIRLRDVNLIGVYGQPNNRRALVRLGNGRYVKVEIGSTLDGGQVTAIGDSALNYVKRGRTIALQLPSG